MELSPRLAPRLARLPTITVAGYEVPVARTAWPRLLGLAWLDRDRAGTGLLIPGCRSIHTFGMRFAIEVVFLDPAQAEVGRRIVVGPGRIIVDRRADSVLELVLRPGEVEGGEVGRFPD